MNKQLSIAEKIINLLASTDGFNDYWDSLGLHNQKNIICTGNGNSVDVSETIFSV